MECRSELAVLARRGRLGAHEQAALAAHLSSCADCRLTFKAGAAFDGGATLEPDDGMRIARMGIAARRWAEATGAKSKAPRPARSRWRIALIAACWCLVAAVASGAVVLTQDQREAPSQDASERTASAQATAPPAAAAPVAEPAPVAPAPEDIQPVLAPAAVEARRSLPAETAKALFQRASAARRSGDTTLARSLYQRLAREFPATAEAALSRLKLGSLFLDAGEPAPALAEFDAYLAAARGGALAPEALYGRGRALAALGRPTDERKTWARLLREFPASPYAAHARRRLAGDAP